MIPHPALSDNIAGEEVKPKNERLMQCNYYTNFTKFSDKNKRNYKRSFLTKVFAELFSKSDRVPRRHTNNSELAKSRMFSYITTQYTAFFFHSCLI